MSLIGEVVVPCFSEGDISREIAVARADGVRLRPRGGGHCLAGRSSTAGIVLDLGGMDEIRVDPSGTATIGAGCLLGRVYGELRAVRRTLPAGCGATVGIAGLTLGGGIGLLGRLHGLTCDRLVSARVVLADGEVVECDEHREPDLFWALRGAGGGQFGVVSSFRFATIPEPLVSRVEITWPDDEDLIALLASWQAWAPDAPDGITLDLVVERVPGRNGLRARAFGSSTLPVAETVTVLQDFLGTGASARLRTEAPVPYSTVKEIHADEHRGMPQDPIRLRSEFFEQSIDAQTLGDLLSLTAQSRHARGRRLAFTAMGGAYNRVSPEATAFAHRRTRFLLEHVGAPDDPWIDDSWRLAHTAGSGRVYPNFPDPLLENPLASYHDDNVTRLSQVKRRYDPHRFFDFDQAVPPAPLASASLRDQPSPHDRKESRS